MKEKILEAINNSKVINTHSHHRNDDFFIDFNLDKLLENTYISWSKVDFDKSEQSRQNYLDKVRFKSYFVWLHKALKEIYGIKDELSAQNWDYYSDIINSYHKDKNWHKEILNNNCKYEKIILDTYWEPGSNNGDPGLFCPTFRINPLFFGYSKDAFDHNDNNVYKLYGREFNDIDEYVFFIRELVKEKINNGCVAVKNALAYDRPLDFKAGSRDDAQKVFKNRDNITENEIRLFQDYIFGEICSLAAEINIPLQCHTGMGRLEKTNALNLMQTIQSNPETKFVLFHGSFPWTDDIAGLLHAYPNVYCDICWLPLLSPTAAQYSLAQMIEIGTSDKIFWGCDTWTSEESYAAKIALTNVLADVLSQKIEKNYLSLNDAEIIIENILYQNPVKMYDFFKANKESK
ncbi:MAG: amidohydrolase family protein [Actinomycetota bacterium]|nr:amidohydrolase family protein [Actinomycetota bacterium]